MKKKDDKKILQGVKKSLTTSKCTLPDAGEREKPKIILHLSASRWQLGTSHVSTSMP
jgi:hypothetical protein